MDQPLSGTLAPPWVFVWTSPIFIGDGGQNPRRTFRSPYPWMVSPISVHFELGPRSLDPAAVFAARMPSLFETRRRLTTSATAIDVRATKPSALISSQGRWPRPPSFSSASRRSSLSSDAWRAALRSLRQPRCWFVPVARVCPAAMPSKVPHHRRVLPRRCVVRINQYGSKDRVKDASRSACDGVPCLRPVPTLIGRRTTALPSSAVLRTSAVTGAFDIRGGSR
jgi:hypothetical protein